MVLLRSLKYSIMLKTLLEDMKQEIIVKNRESSEPAHYCVICDVCIQIKSFEIYLNQLVFINHRLKFLISFLSKKSIENISLIVTIVLARSMLILSILSSWKNTNWKN